MTSPAVAWVPLPFAVAAMMLPLPSCATAMTGSPSNRVHCSFGSGEKAAVIAVVPAAATNEQRAGPPAVLQPPDNVDVSGEMATRPIVCPGVIGTVHDPEHVVTTLVPSETWTWPTAVPANEIASSSGPGPEVTK